jgi:acetamidase/formamidase
MSRHHEIPATPETMVWGYFDAALPPVLEVDSGDTVTLTSWMAGYREQLHPDPGRVDPRHLAAIEQVPPGPGAHFMTGPVHVRGAAPGDVLEIEILEHAFPCDWGYTCILPLLGTIPEDFDLYEVIHPDLDRERGLMVLPWGKEIALDPFFGVIAVAPPAHWGRCPSPPPRAFGGNMDNKELKPGSTLYLPVFNEGALFMAGDGHGVQGDGEVCISALETALTGSFRLTVRKDLGYRQPFAENPTHLISIGLDEDLDDAARQAVREMVEHVCRRTPLTRSQAYMLCSLAGDLRVTQTVDGVKGCHMMLAKTAL